VKRGDKPLETNYHNIIFQLNTRGYDPYVTSSVTIRWVCRLQFLLGLVRTVIFRPHLPSRIGDSPNLGGQVSLFISPRKKAVINRLESLCNLGRDRIENTASSSSSIVACVSVGVDTCLSTFNQAMFAFFSYNIIIFTAT
jgi:hypothetical protein